MGITTTIDDNICIILRIAKKISKASRLFVLLLLLFSFLLLLLLFLLLLGLGKGTGMNGLPLLNIFLNVLSQATNFKITATKLIHSLIKWHHNNFEKSTLVLGKNADIREILHEWSLRKAKFPFHFVLIAEFKIDLKRPSLAYGKLLG